VSEQAKVVAEQAAKAEAAAPPEPKVEEPVVKTTPAVVVPEVTKEPEWHLSKEEWDANQNVMKTLAEKIPGLEGISNALSPLVDAINDVTREEQAPQKKKPWFRRKIGSKE
jgi:hypothetical protein